MTEDDIEYKYDEDKIIDLFRSYVDATYDQHYSTEDEEISCFDAWKALGSATSTCRDTAMKYLWRYGKKDGSNIKDLMKAMHYIVLAIHNDHFKEKK
jgi:hypothetical protein